MGYLKIFQIGGTIVPLFQQKLSNSYDNKSRGDETDLLSSMNPLVRDTQFLQKTRDLKVSGFILDIAQTKADWVEQMLRSYVGKPLPIIAYYVHNSHIQEYSQCCNCRSSKKCCVTFYQAIGIVDSVDDLKEGDWADPLELSFSIKLVTHWRGLDRLLWNWGGYPINAANTPINISHEFIETLNSSPSCEELFKSCQECDKGFFPIEYSDCSYIYDSFYLERRICGLDCGDNSCCNKNFGQVFPSIVGGGKYFLNKLSQKEWGIPPLSIYIFEGINGLGRIKIGIRGNDGGIRSVARDTYIDIDATNLILTDNNYEELDSDDKIVIGDFSLVANDKIIKKAAIIRNDEILEIQPIVIYPDLFPAMIFPSDNASFFATGNFNSYTAAHYFRRA